MACHHHLRGPRIILIRALHACPHAEIEFGIWSVRCGNGQFPSNVLYGCGSYFHAVSFCDVGTLCCDCLLSGFGPHDGLDSYYDDADAVPGVIFGRLLSYDLNFVPDFGYGWLAPASR